MIDWLSLQLTIENPVFLEAQKRGRYIGKIPQFLKLYRPLPEGIIVPRGYLQLLEEILIGKGLNLEIQDNRVLLKPIEFEFSPTLNVYQEMARRNMLSHPNGMLIAPAASGKTIIGLSLMATIRQPTLWLTHTKRLANQVIERCVGTDEFKPVFPDMTKKEIGLIGMGKDRIGERLTVGIIASLTRRDDLLALGKKFGMVILDESHHSPSKTFTKVLTFMSSFYMYGLTATPYRRDKLEELMFATIGQGNAIILRKEVKDEGRIITPSVIRRDVPMPLVDDNDYHRIIHHLVMVDLNRKRLIATDVFREARRGGCCIVIGTIKVYCEDLYTMISQYWPKTVIATGDYSNKHNDAQVKKIENGEATVLITTFELLGEGFDVPKLNRAFLALPFRERARVEQMVGRIQRTAPNKDDAIIYDYVDTNIGILNNQFRAREAVYRSLGMSILEDA